MTHDDSENAFQMLARLGKALFDGRAEGDAAAVAEAVDDLEVMEMHTLDPEVRGVCGSLLKFRNV